MDLSDWHMRRGAEEPPPGARVHSDLTVPALPRTAAAGRARRRRPWAPGEGRWAAGNTGEEKKVEQVGTENK